MQSSERQILGIVGGMGPLASAGFLRAIYRFHLVEPEQGSPSCLLDSDPTFPDRTEAIRDGRTRELAEKLSRSVEGLVRLGASRVVIACVTVHCVLADLEETLRRRVVSLIDLAVDEILAAGDGPLLLLSTSGTRAARIFESHERWPSVAGRVIHLGDEDQERLHAWIYRLKTGAPGAGCLDWIGALRERYGAAGLVFGCTELHLLQETIAARGGDAGCGILVDPLWTAARDLPRLLAPWKPDPKNPS